MTNALSVLLAGFIFFLAFTLGNKLLKIFKLNLGDLAVPCSAVLGLGALSYLVLLLGACNGFKSVWLWSLVGGLALVLSPSFKDSFYLIMAEASFAGNVLNSRFFKILFLAYVALLTFNSFIPDQFYDVLVYHLALPQTYLVNGGIIPVPYNVHSALPETAEMLFTLGMGLVAGDNLPLLFQLGFAVLIILTLFRLDPACGKIAALVWATAPIVIENIRFSKNDILFSLLILAAFAVLWKERDNLQIRHLILAGVFMGFASGTKYAGIIFAIGFSVFSFRKGFLGFAVYGTAALLVFSPWMVKNYIFFHNPLYPFFQDFFGWVNMTPLNWNQFQSEQSQYGPPGWRWFDLGKTFWKLTLEGHRFPSMNFIGPVWLTFLPWILFKGWTSRFTRVLMAFVISAIVFSATQTTLARYFILPILPFFALAIAQSIQSAKSPLTALALNVLLIAGMSINAVGWRPLLERLAYCRTAIWRLSPEKHAKLYSDGYLESAQFVNGDLPEDSKILFMGETRSHLFKRRLIAPSVHNEHLFSQLLNSSANVSELHEKLKSAGITHLLYNESEMARLAGYPEYNWKKEHNVILKKFWSKHLTLTHSNSAVDIYELTDRPDEKKPLTFPRHLDAVSS